MAKQVGTCFAISGMHIEVPFSKVPMFHSLSHEIMQRIRAHTNSPEKDIPNGLAPIVQNPKGNKYVEML